MSPEIATATPPVRTSKWTAERVKALRIGLEITQAQMSERIGVALRAYQKWEDGGPNGRNPSGMAVKALNKLEFMCASKMLPKEFRKDKEGSERKPKEA